jgi:chromate reductase, NAD(P)H dehydrogenase (quinone)
VPEYNGTFPGVFKMLLDNSDIKTAWWHKRAMLVGVAAGRAGNLRGLDHLTNILNYIKVLVLPSKVPISNIAAELTDAGHFASEATLKTAEAQVQDFLDF